MQKATEALAREHRTIEKVVVVMGRVLEQLSSGRNIDAEILRDLLDFFRIFCDQYHRGREESYLFPLLEAKGVPPTGCPIAVLREEHGNSQLLVDDLSSSVADYLADRQSSTSELIGALQNLVTFFPAHIWKEEYLLLPMAEKVLSAADQEKLLQQFDLAELDMGGSINSEFEALADHLSERAESCPRCSGARPTQPFGIGMVWDAVARHDR